MRLTCTSFRVVDISDDKTLTLEIEQGVVAPADARLFIPEIAAKMRIRPKSVSRLASRKRNPLPLIRGNGRPYALLSRLEDWLAKTDTKPTLAFAAARL